MTERDGHAWQRGGETALGILIKGLQAPFALSLPANNRHPGKGDPACPDRPQAGIQRLLDLFPEYFTFFNATRYKWRFIQKTDLCFPPPQKALRLNRGA
jgi:hypothetical protein